MRNQANNGDGINFILENAQSFTVDVPIETQRKEKFLDVTKEQLEDLTPVDRPNCEKTLMALIAELEIAILEAKLAPKGVKKVDFIDLLTWRDTNCRPLFALFQIHPEPEKYANLFGLADFSQDFSTMRRAISGIDTDVLPSNTVYECYSDIFEAWEEHARKMHPLRAFLSKRAALFVHPPMSGIAFATVFSGYIPEYIKQEIKTEKYTEKFSHLLVVNEAYISVPRHGIEEAIRRPSHSLTECVLIGKKHDNYYLLNHFKAETVDWVRYRNPLSAAS